MKQLDRPSPRRIGGIAPTMRTVPHNRGRLTRGPRGPGILRPWSRPADSHHRRAMPRARDDLEWRREAPLGQIIPCDSKSILRIGTDPEGFEPSRAGLEIRSPIRARRRVRSRARNANANNPSTGGFGNRYVAAFHLGSRGGSTSFGSSYLERARLDPLRPRCWERV